MKKIALFSVIALVAGFFSGYGVCLIQKTQEQSKADLASDTSYLSQITKASFDDDLHVDFNGENYIFSKSKGKDGAVLLTSRDPDLDADFSVNIHDKETTLSSESFSSNFDMVNIRRGSGFLSILPDQTISGEAQAGHARLFGIPMGNPVLQIDGTTDAPSWTLSGESIRQKTVLRSGAQKIDFTVQKIVADGDRQGITKLFLSGKSAKGIPMDMEITFPRD